MNKTAGILIGAGVAAVAGILIYELVKPKPILVQGQGTVFGPGGQITTVGGPDQTATEIGAAGNALSNVFNSIGNL